MVRRVVSDSRRSAKKNMSEPLIAARLLRVESALFHTLRDMKHLQAENHALREFVASSRHPDFRSSPEEAVRFLTNRKAEVLEELLIALERENPELSARLAEEPEPNIPPEGEAEI